MNILAVRGFSEAKRRKRRGPIALRLDPLGAVSRCALAAAGRCPRE